MKSILSLAVVLAVVAVVCQSSVIKDTRANLIVGGVVAGDRLLSRSYVSRAAIANSVQSQDVIWRGNATNRITSVQALEVGVSQLAAARIINGGVGRNNVTVRFQSQRGRGYYYQLDIWGR